LVIRICFVLRISDFGFEIRHANISQYIIISKQRR